MKTKKILVAKFAFVAVMAGFLSPSIQIEQKDNQSNLKISILQKAEARRGGGGAKRGGGNSNRNKNSNRNTNVNRNTNKNTNVNVNRNKNTNVNVNVNNNRYHGGGHRHGYYRGRPLAIFATGLVIGTMITASTMPTTCTTVIANGISYRKCSNSYYQPFYEGDTLVYQVVASPY